MSVAVKSLLARLLSPVARLARRASGPGRLWAYALLAADLQPPLDPSVVVLGRVEVHGTGDVTLGRDLYLYPGLYLETRGGGSIAVGDSVVISRGVHLVSFARLEIGAGSMIGEYATVRDANHRFDGRDSPRDLGHDARPVRIGRNVWLARGVCVLPGVTIGDGAVVGANAVVTHDVAAGAVVAGVPARPIVPSRRPPDEAARR